ncbi:MAG: hypothetical protein JO205_11920 [Pseudolabrys sp.]|nr:hypothetical protein [Pseudolabrys sp.]
MADPDNSTQPQNASGKELPNVPSPSISPADDAHKDAAPGEPVPASNALTLFIEKAKQEAPKVKSRFKFPDFTFTIPDLAITLPHILITRRMKRYAYLTGTFLFAAACGAVAGLAVSQSHTSAKVDTASLEETQAMQKSIAHLTREIATLKSGVDAAAKSANAQIGKVNERVAKIEQSDITGSISKPATVATVPTPAPVAPAPMPQARPQTTPTIVPGWTARAARNGAILVENQGDTYEVSPGVPLPGLGAVESIKRDGDRWVVSTPKGIIVSSNAPPPRPRPYYTPYYYRPY